MQGINHPMTAAPTALEPIPPVERNSPTDADGPVRARSGLGQKSLAAAAIKKRKSRVSENKRSNGDKKMGEKHKAAQHRRRVREFCERTLAAHRPELYGYTLKRCNGNCAEAEELLQTAIQRVLGQKKPASKIKTPVAWFKRIIRNAWITKEKKEKKKRTESLDKNVSGSGDDPRRPVEPSVQATQARVLEDKETFRTIARALKALPAVERNVFLLRAYGVQSAEVATQLELEVVDVYKLYDKVKKILRKACGKSNPVTTKPATKKTAGLARQRRSRLSPAPRAKGARPQRSTPKARRD
jgi:RNA polymerase sigma factor (sigma-70 family)